MIGAAFGFVLSFGVYILGMVGRVAYPDISMLPGGSAEYIMPMMALSNLPPVLSGLILAGATAAIMSTAKRTASCHRIFRRKRSSDHDPSRSKRGT